MPVPVEDLSSLLGQVPWLQQLLAVGHPARTSEVGAGLELALCFVARAALQTDERGECLFVCWCDDVTGRPEFDCCRNVGGGAVGNVFRSNLPGHEAHIGETGVQKPFWMEGVTGRHRGEVTLEEVQ